VGDLDGDGSPELLLGGLLGEGYLFAGVHDPMFQPTYTCAPSGNCTVALPPTGGLQGTFGLGAATATFSGASSVSGAGSPGNFAGRVFVGGPDLTGAGAPTLMVGAPAQARFGATNNGAGWVYLVEGN
ncbi:MAG: hypothetical protein AAF211_28930, partial [Myxococcota bacterium]